MVINAPHHNSASDIARTVSLLNDIYAALNDNALTEEARVVEEHLRQLSDPEVVARIETSGVQPVLVDFAREFTDTVTAG